MNNVKSSRIFKRLSALVMAMALTCALGVAANAAEPESTSTSYTVTITQADGTASMANDIVAGAATVTPSGDGVQISIPIKPITNYSPMSFLPAADGYLRTLTVTGATSATVTPADVLYTEGAITIVLPGALPTDGKLVVSTSHIDLYSAGTSDPYTFIDHVSPDFVIVLS